MLSTHLYELLKKGKRFCLYFLIQPFALILAFKPAYPDVQVLFFLGHKTSYHNYAFRYLEGYYFLFHQFDPFATLPGLDTILTKLK